MKWPIIGDLVDWVGGWFKGKMRIREARVQGEERRLTNQQNHENEWEVTAERDKDRWLRRLSFAMFSAPFFVAIFDPAQVKLYFDESIQSVPEWWQQTYIAITGTIWGISSLKNIVPSFIFNTKRAWVKSKELGVKKSD